MFRVTWRNLFARKLRLFLSAFAIVLGVAFVAGALIFTDGINGAFDDIIEGSTADVEVAPAGAADFDSGEDVRTIPATVVDDLDELPEVESVHPNVTAQSVYVIGASGKVVGGTGAPGLASNVTDTRAITGKRITTLIKGSLPDAPGELALDEDTARKAGYQVGDSVTLVTPTEPPKLETTLTGIVEFGSGSGINGATLALFDTRFLQDRFLGGKDAYNSISLDAAPGITQQELADAAQAVLPKGVEARTGDDVVKQNEQVIDEILGYLQTFLLVFAGIALVVGIFLIINTFSILVAQRSRELALLRAIGASGRQVNRSVLTEAVATGLVGSTVGLGAGYLLALGLKALFATFGLDLGRASLPVHWTTVVACYAVGLIVTVIAGYLPARRASRIPPVAALRDDVALPEQALRRRALVAAVLLVIGVGSLVAGFRGDGGGALSLIGLGLLLVLIGVALLAPLIARPFIRGFAVIYRRLFGAVGTLATENSLRNPRRTAATASALMIGLALVTMMSILGRSASASADDALNQAVTSQFVISNVVGDAFSTDIARQVRRLPDIENVAELRQGPAKVGSSDIFVGAVDPREFQLALLLPMEQGSFADLRSGSVVLSHDVAASRQLDVGDEVTVSFQGGDRPLTVAGVLRDQVPAPAEWFVTLDTLQKGGLAPRDSYLFVNAAPSADVDTVRDELEKVTADLPTVTVKDPQGFADEQKGQIDGFINFIYALLGLSIVIAVLGVINTLALSIVERTREVGLLRAIGVTRRQLRTIIRLESIVIAVFGAILGITVGVAFGLALISALRDDGLTRTVVPYGSLVLFVLVAAVIGVVAAVVPARRAAKLDVLTAITTQ